MPRKPIQIYTWLILFLWMSIFKPTAKRQSAINEGFDAEFTCVVYSTNNILNFPCYSFDQLRT